MGDLTLGQAVAEAEVGDLLNEYQQAHGLSDADMLGILAGCQETLIEYVNREVEELMRSFW